MEFSSPSPIVSRDFLQTKGGIRGRGLLAVLFSLILCMTACPKNPTISLNNVTNQCGGTLYVNGSGFTKGGKVQISATNTPGSPGVQAITTATADSSGNISVPIPYYNPGGGGLPGCAFGSGATTAVTILAVDEATGSPASAVVNIRNCNMVWGQQCPA